MCLIRRKDLVNIKIKYKRRKLLCIKRQCSLYIDIFRKSEPDSNAISIKRRILKQFIRKNASKQMYYEKVYCVRKSADNKEYASGEEATSNDTIAVNLAINIYYQGTKLFLKKAKNDTT